MGFWGLGFNSDCKPIAESARGSGYRRSRVSCGSFRKLGVPKGYLKGSIGVPLKGSIRV